MKRILLLRLIILLSLPSYSQTVLTKVDFLVLRMDYQSTELKSIYRFDQTIDMSSLSEQRGQYHGLDITIVPAGDFGWTKIRSTMSNQDVYHATTVWDGTGRHLYPTQDLEIKPGDSTLVLTDPEFIDIVDFYFDQEDYKRTDSVFTAVKGTKLPQTFARNTAYGAMIYLHYFSVGMNDPRTAEWIIILYSLPDHIMPYFEAQWVEITGSLSQDPLSPHIRAIAPHSFFGDSLWIGTAGGAYFSPNSGEQWNAISFDDCYQVDVPVVVTTPNPFVNCLCSVVGLGTDEPITGSSEWHGRIFRSMIDGHTWEDTQAPTFAVTALAFDPHNPDTMYAGLFNENLRQGGLYRLDPETGWKEIKFLSTDVPPFPKIRCITIDPLDLGHLFIGTEKGLYVTHDYGGSWHPALESFKIVSILISHFENRHILFAATSGRSKSDGIYQSPDDGKSWEVVHWRTNIVALTQWIPELWSHQKFPAQYFMATYGEGVYQSQDGCRSWREIDNGLTEKRYTSLAVHSSRRGQLYLGTENGLFKYAPILPSIDLRLDDQDLAFWPPQPKDGELVEIYATVHNESPVAVFNVAICFTDNADGMLPVIVPIDTLVIPSIRPYSECTLRAEWSPRGQTGDNLIFVQVDPANQIAELNERNNLASIHIYLDKPLSNRYWVDISRDLPDKWIRDIASHPFNRGEIFIGTNAGAFTAGLMEKHWKQLTFDESSAVKVTRIAAEPHPYLDWTVPVLWLGTEEYSLIPEDRLGRAFRSQDGGEHWRDTRYPGSAVCALAIPAGNSLMAYIASYNPFYSIDEFFICEDTLWTSHDLTPEDTAAYRINCFAFSQEEIDIGTTNGFHIIGKDQHLIDHSLKKLNVVSIIRPIRYRDRAIYAATRGKNLNDGIHRSYDEGKSWEQIASFEDIVSLVAVNHSTEIEAVAPHFYLALYGQGVFESRNGGQFWTDITSNLNEKRITCLAVDRRNPEIVYLGTENGIFYFNDPGATLVRNPEPAVSITRSFRLHQNHPNPFNHATMIPFELPEEAQVDIGIYNTLGQRIKSFPCHHFLKGTQHIVWDGTDDSGNGVNSGLYLCRVKYRNFQAQIKLIYLK